MCEIWNREAFEYKSFYALFRFRLVTGRFLWVDWSFLCYYDKGWWVVWFLVVFILKVGSWDVECFIFTFLMRAFSFLSVLGSYNLILAPKAMAMGLALTSKQCLAILGRTRGEKVSVYYFNKISKTWLWGLGRWDMTVNCWL